MRSVIAVTTAVTMLVSGFPSVPAFAQNTVTPVRLEAVTKNKDTVNPAIVAIFKAFPQGGEALSNRIADFIVSNRKLAPELANYVVYTPGLTKAQKIAAERGLAAALERLGINAADLGPPVYKAPPAPVVEEAAFNPLWLLAAAALIGVGVCAIVCGCFRSCEHAPVPVTGS
jgi:hypothetical protein